MDPAQIKLIEQRYQACWHCIQNGLQDKCRHYQERKPEFARAGNIAAQVLAHIKRSKR